MIKGFIELTKLGGGKILFRIDSIAYIEHCPEWTSITVVGDGSDWVNVEEKYSDIKFMLEK